MIKICNSFRTGNVAFAVGAREGWGAGKTH